MSIKKKNQDIIRLFIILLVGCVIFTSGMVGSPYSKEIARTWYVDFFTILGGLIGILAFGFTMYTINQYVNDPEIEKKQFEKVVELVNELLSWNISHAKLDEQSGTESVGWTYQGLLSLDKIKLEVGQNVVGLGSAALYNNKVVDIISSVYFPKEINTSNFFWQGNISLHQLRRGYEFDVLDIFTGNFDTTNCFKKIEYMVHVNETDNMTELIWHSLNSYNELLIESIKWIKQETTYFEHLNIPDQLRL